MHRAFSSWSSGSQQVGGDSVQKTVSQVEWMGMSNTLVRNSLGRIYWHYSSSNMFALQSPIKCCSYEGHLFWHGAQAVQVSNGPWDRLVLYFQLSCILPPYIIVILLTTDSCNNCLWLPVSAVFCIFSRKICTAKPEACETWISIHSLLNATKLF